MTLGYFCGAESEYGTSAESFCGEKPQKNRIRGDKRDFRCCCKGK